MILLLETATSVCSVALSQEGRVVCERHSDQPNAHSSRLSVFVDELLQEASISPRDLEAVCVSSGPGSYTGLRIGVSSAKGFCYGLKVPMLSVPTLQSMAALYYRQHPDYKGLVCPMIDARRMECYSAFYQAPDRIHTPQPIEVKGVSADIIEEGIYDEYLDRGTVVFIGDGAAKTHPLLSLHHNARFDDDFQIAAEGMAEIAYYMLREDIFEDVAYFEPFYLKDFVAKKSVVRGLR